jgi:hypothetical protein
MLNCPERDENSERKDFTPTAALVMAEQLEPLEREAAKERQGIGKKEERISEDTVLDFENRVGACSLPLPVGAPLRVPLLAHGRPECRSVDLLLCIGVLLFSLEILVKWNGKE